MADYDIAIIGCGVAGVSAAKAAADQGVRCVVVGSDPLRTSSNIDWVSPAGLNLLTELGVSAESVGIVSPESIVLQSADRANSVNVVGDDLTVGIVDPQRLCRQVLSSAQAAGATIETSVSAIDVAPGEVGVDIVLSDGRELSSEIVLLDDDLSASRLDAIGVRSASQYASDTHVLEASGETSKKSEAFNIILGDTRKGVIGCFIQSAGRWLCRLSGRGQGDCVNADLRVLIAAAAEAGAIGVGDVCDVKSLAFAGKALDMETHIGKRILLIGEAGGFSSALSAETLFCEAASGRIAATVATEALRSSRAQDRLATFGVRWRSEIADYLRLPNADLGLLLPLAFKNEQIAQRVSRAFLLGTDF